MAQSQSVPSTGPRGQSRRFHLLHLPNSYFILVTGLSSRVGRFHHPLSPPALRHLLQVGQLASVGDLVGSALGDSPGLCHCVNADFGIPILADEKSPLLDVSYRPQPVLIEA